MGTTVSNGVTQVLNVAFAKLPNPGGSNCVPVQGGDPQAPAGNFGFTSSNGLVDSNANELWSVLVCKPWLDGELGTTQYATSPKAPQTVVNTYGRQLLWAQAIAVNEHPTADLIQAKQATYNGIASSLQQNNPSVYALFQGNQWTTRLEVGFAALFAAIVAGLLILLIALTLIILKLGFLLLLIAGPFFLIIGTHPGFGRIIAIRWFEMLVGVLMKQVAVALALSVLLYAYSLIMGTSDAVLPWALKILMIALVTVAVFIYRKPFQHLFSAVGYGVIGSQERADISLRQASTTFRRVTRDTATVAVPGVAAYRVGRWARRNPGEAAALAAGVVGAAGAVSAGAAASKVAAAQAAGAARGAAGGAAGGGPDDAAARARAGADGASADDDPAAQAGQGRPATAERAKRWPGGDADGGRRSAPPLNLPPRAGAAEGAPASGWSRTSAQAGAAARSGEAPPRPGSAVRVTPPSSGGQPAAPAARDPRPQREAGTARPVPADRRGPQPEDRRAPPGRPGPRPLPARPRPAPRRRPRRPPSAAARRHPGTVPAGTVPAGTVPAGTVPAGTALAAGPVPAGTAQAAGPVPVPGAARAAAARAVGPGPGRRHAPAGSPARSGRPAAGRDARVPPSHRKARRAAPGPRGAPAAEAPAPPAGHRLAGTGAGPVMRRAGPAHRPAGWAQAVRARQAQETGGTAAGRSHRKHRCPSGSVRYGAGSSTARWTCPQASRRPCSPSSSWFWPGSAPT